MQSARYRYGNFFGITAIHLMYMSEAEIERIFNVTSIRTGTKLLVKNLYTEVEALKAIFSDEKVKTLPHVIVKKDNSSTDVRDLISGFNYMLECKAHAVKQPEQDSDLDFSALSALDTDFFDTSNASVSEPDEKPIAFSPQQETSLFTDEFDTSALDAIGSDELDLSNEFKTSTLDALEPEGPQLEDLFSSIEDIDNSEPTVSCDYSDLISLGRAHPETQGVVNNVLQISRYMLSHKDEFTEEERDLISKQIADLPKVPSSVEVPAQFVERSGAISPKSMDILLSLYAHMYRKTTPKGAHTSVYFVDYVSEKLKLMLISRASTVRRLFFASQSDFSRDLSVNRCNNFLADLNNTYLTQTHVSTVLGNVESLIVDCNETLGLTSNIEERKLIHSLRSLSREYMHMLETSLNSTDIEVKEMEWWNTLLELLGTTTILEQYQESTKQFFIKLLRADKFIPLLDNPANLKVLAAINNAMFRVVTSELGGKLNRSLLSAESLDNITVDDVARLCTLVYLDFTKETGIMGYMCTYDSKITKTLNEIVTPLEQKVNIVFLPNTENYRMSYLLRKHLKSLQSRLQNYR